MIYFDSPPPLRLPVVTSLYLNNDRWLPSKELSRRLPQQALLSIAVTDCSFSQGDEFSGSLSLLPSSETFGVIAS